MVIIHADSRVSTNLNRFDQIHLSLAPNDGTWRIYAVRDHDINLYRVQLGAFDTEKEALKRYEVISKNWAYGMKWHDMNESIEEYF